MEINNLLKRLKESKEFKEWKKDHKDSFLAHIFKMIDDAEKLSKKYEFKLKEGIFLDCPYDNIINIYRQARKRFEEIGWEDQSNKLIHTINYYKDKLEAVKKDIKGKTLVPLVKYLKQ